MGITGNHTCPFVCSKKSVRLVLFQNGNRWEWLLSENDHSTSLAGMGMGIIILESEWKWLPNNVATGSSAPNHALRSTLTLSRKLEPGKREESRRSATKSWNCYVKWFPVDSGVFVWSVILTHSHSRMVVIYILKMPNQTQPKCASFVSPLSVTSECRGHSKLEASSSFELWILQNVFYFDLPLSK